MKHIKDKDIVSIILDHDFKIKNSTSEDKIVKINENLKQILSSKQFHVNGYLVGDKKYESLAESKEKTEEDSKVKMMSSILLDKIGVTMKLEFILQVSQLRQILATKKSKLIEFKNLRVTPLFSKDGDTVEYLGTLCINSQILITKSSSNTWVHRAVSNKNLQDIIYSVQDNKDGLNQVSRKKALEADGNDEDVLAKNMINEVIKNNSLFPGVDLNLGLQDDNSLNGWTVIYNLDIKLRDFSLYLRKPLDRIIFSLTSIQNVYSLRETIDIAGVILSIKTEDKLTIMELSSVKDSNVFKVHLYNKKLSLKINIGTVVHFRKIQLKISKSLELILENPMEYNTEILGNMSSSEVSKLRKFRFDSSSNFNTILELCKPVLVRNILKVKKLF